MANQQYDVDQIYPAIAQAETGGETNPYIRTRVDPEGGSTAFGPVQITGKLAKAYRDKGLLSKDMQDFHDQVMQPMYQNFSKYGNEPKAQGYQPQFDYGGTGNFNPDLQAQNYQQYAKEIMQNELSKSGGNIDKFIERWRGVSEKEDPTYFKKVKSALEQNVLGQELARQVQ